LSDTTPFGATFAVDGPNCAPVTLEVTITGTANFPVTWTTTNSATRDTETGSGTSPFKLAPLEEGDYVIEIKDGVTNCILTEDQTIAPDPSVPIALAPDLCAMTLTASGGTSYDWTATPVSAFATPPGTGAVAQLAPNAGTVTYTVTGTGAGCPGTDSVTLDVGTVPTPALSQSTACADFATITVDPSGTFNYRWFVNGTFDIGLGGSTIQLTRNDNGNEYHVTIYEPQSGCTKTSDDLTAAVVGVVDATLTSTPPCADGLPITLTALTTDPTGASYAWARDGGALVGVTTSTTQQDAEGTYSVEISKATCKATSSLAIKRSPLPEGQLANVAIICDDPENTDPETRQVDLDPGVFASYEWAKNGVSLGATDRVFTADSKGAYEVTITDARGCKNIDKIDVLNECIPRINAPNAFRPGSTVFNPDRKDLTNGDFWIITRFIEDDQFKVFIFNRWGEMVFSSTDRFFKWNGGYNNDIGRPLPPGTYSYVVQYVSAFRPSEGVKEKRGGVALIR
jgi:gliding motility-associated-like protein